MGVHTALREYLAEWAGGDGRKIRRRGHDLEPG